MLAMLACVEPSPAAMSASCHPSSAAPVSQHASVYWTHSNAHWAGVPCSCAPSRLDAISLPRLSCPSHHPPHAPTAAATLQGLDLSKFWLSWAC